MGTDKVTFVVGQPEEALSEVCSAHARFFPTFFSYYSSSTKCSTVVQVPWLPVRSREPFGVPLGVGPFHQK